MSYQAIVIGASAGGLDALSQVLSPLPADFPLPLLVVQHRLPSADDLLPNLLNEICNLLVQEAIDKASIQAGQVYVAPANYHLLVEWDKTLALSVDSKVCYARPALDVLFESAADVYQNKLIGVLLTGANHDGTAGFAHIKKRGGLTIAQDPTTAYVDIMPQTAIKAGVVEHIVPLDQIAAFLQKITTDTAKLART